jgi:hypothetical protein
MSATRIECTYLIVEKPPTSAFLSSFRQGQSMNEKYKTNHKLARARQAAVFTKGERYRILLLSKNVTTKDTTTAGPRYDTPSGMVS